MEHQRNSRPGRVPGLLHKTRRLTAARYDSLSGMILSTSWVAYAICATPWRR